MTIYGPANTASGVDICDAKRSIFQSSTSAKLLRSGISAILVMLMPVLIASAQGVALPTLVSVTPASGTGSTQTFSAVYSDPNGIGGMNNVRLLLNTTSIKGVNACYVEYYLPGNRLYLENDADTELIGPIQPGSSSSISNSQCTLSGEGSSVTESGDNITVNFAITFASTYTGSKNIYLLANDGFSTGWVEMGAWTPVSLGPPTIVSVTPASGTGSTQTFSAVYSDPNGIGGMNNVRLLLNPAINGVDGCYVFYYPRTNFPGYTAGEMFLGNDADNGIIGPLIPGLYGGYSIYNSQCTLYSAGSSVTESGDNLTVNFALTFASTYTGAKNIYLEANNAGDSSAGPSSGWVEMGTWTP
jgi:hypothetical protein